MHHPLPLRPLLLLSLLLPPPPLLRPLLPL
jgi:hypothetical protein